MLKLNRIHATRIVATPAALEAARWPAKALALRLASDEMLVTAPVPADSIADPHAIVVPDASFAGGWVEAEAALDFLARACEWKLPAARPAFAQGAVAGLPLKLWLEETRVLFLVPAPYASDLEERMS